MAEVEAFTVDEDIVLIIYPINGAAEALFRTESLNEVFRQQGPLQESNTTIPFPPTADGLSRTSRESTQEIKEPQLTWVIKLDHAPRRGRSWVFGRDPLRCDILLEPDSHSGQAGVSACHFEIHYHVESKVLILANISSSNPTCIRVKDEPLRPCRSTRVLEAGSITTITAGRVHLGFLPPARSGANLESFNRRLGLWLNDGIEDGGMGTGLAVEDVDSALVDRAPPLIEETLRMFAEGDLIEIKPLGHGSFGRVDLVCHRTTGQTYARKIITLPKPDDSSEEWRVRKSQAERQVLESQLDHPFIIECFGVIEEASSVSLLLRYCSHGDLHKEAENRRFSQDETKQIADQQCSALEYLHGKGITHRDIKPNNILVFAREPQLITKLSDFGECSKKDNMATIAGAALYHAPEMKKLKQAKYGGPRGIASPPADRESLAGIITSKVDVYAMGLVFITLLEGEEQTTEALVGHATKAFGSLAECSINMLAIRPEERPSARECVAMLSAARPPYWSHVPRQTPLTRSMQARRDRATP